MDNGKTVNWRDTTRPSSSLLHGILYYMALRNAFTLLPRGHRILILLLSTLLGGLLLWPLEDAQALRVAAGPDTISTPGPGQDEGQSAPEARDVLAASESPSLQEQTHEVRRGDNLSTLFRRAGLSHGTLYEVTRAGAESENLLTLHPGV